MSIGSSGFAWQQPSALPYFLADDQGTSFERTFGQVKDDALAVLKEAVKARWPDAARPDALPYQGNDRRIRRAPDESDAAYAARLQRAHDIWQWAGTPTAMVNVFAPWGYDATTLAVVPNHQVILEGNAEWFSRFVLLLSSPGRWGPDSPWDNIADEWADATSETWDSNAAMEDLDYMRAEVRTFKSPWSFPVVVAATLFGEGPWDQNPQDYYDVGDFVWDDTPDTIIYWPLGRVWGDEAWLGGSPIWDEAGDTWDDPIVAPSSGWRVML